MKQLITFLTLTFVTTLFGQSSNSATVPIVSFDSIFEEVHFDSLANFDITGTYVTSADFCGYKFILDSNQSFRKIGWSCEGQEKWDSGRWGLQNDNTLFLKGVNTTIYATIIKLGSYYYLVAQSERQKLINDYLEIKARTKKVKPFTIDEHTFPAEYRIKYALLEKYYSKEPVFDFTGT